MQSRKSLFSHLLQGMFSCPWLVFFFSPLLGLVYFFVCLFWFWFSLFILFLLFGLGFFVVVDWMFFGFVFIFFLHHSGSVVTCIKKVSKIISPMQMQRWCQSHTTCSKLWLNHSRIWTSLDHRIKLKADVHWVTSSQGPFGVMVSFLTRVTHSFLDIFFPVLHIIWGELNAVTINPSHYADRVLLCEVSL